MINNRWVPEAPEIRSYYAAKAPRSVGKLGTLKEYGTFDIHSVLQFDSKENCQAWIDRQELEWVPTEHGFFDTE